MEITRNTKKEVALKLGKKCKRCGKCCSFGAGFAQIDELSKIAEFLKISEDKLKKNYFDEKNIFNKKVYEPKLNKKDKMPFGSCIFMKENMCTIQDVKPLHCRVGNCNKYGEDMSEWYTVNYLVDINSPESIRQWKARVDLKPTIKGASPLELVGNKEKLKEIIEYKII